MEVVIISKWVLARGEAMVCGIRATFVSWGALDQTWSKKMLPICKRSRVVINQSKLDGRGMVSPVVEIWRTW